MTSSSKNIQKMCGLSKDVEDKGGKKDWLELTLDFGSNSSFSAPQTSSSSPCFASHSSQQGQQIASGLRIGCDPEDLNTESYHGFWRENQHLCFMNDHLPLSTSALQSNSASSNLLDSHGLLSRPVPNVANHSSQRPNPGLWFTLRSTINRYGEVLPQIPKAYIRVKDPNLTVFMVKTYLVRKLGLFNEDEVEISCMGQNLLHAHTMKHVRDAIWLPKLVELLNSNPTLVENTQFVHHLMSLDYGRSCLINKEL